MRLTKGFYEASGIKYKYWKLNNCICDIRIHEDDNLYNNLTHDVVWQKRFGVNIANIMFDDLHPTARYLFFTYAKSEKWKEFDSKKELKEHNKNFMFQQKFINEVNNE